MHVKVGGVYKPCCENLSVKVSGSYKHITNMYNKVLGVWKEYDLSCASPLPHISNMWLDFQIDSGVTASDSNLTGWTDSVNGNVLLPSTIAPVLDATRSLSGLPTIRTGTTLRYMHKASTITGKPADVYTINTYCILFYGGIYVNPTDWDGHGTQRIILYIYDNTYYYAPSPIIKIVQKPSTMVVSAKVGGSAYFALGTATSGWNVLIVENSLTEGVGRNIRASLNGGDMSVNPFATGAWHNDIDVIEMGAYVRGSTQLFPGNYGALIAWKGVSFTQSDMNSAREYLVQKYGL